jgi:2-polyprenyl-6-methoxyphenol hydroxylase-like FAD-dependent oxidoreductase
MSNTSESDIIIAGGGIGGIAAALALARRGLRVRVLEKAAEFGEIGYGIQIGPNAYRMLDLLGVVDDITPSAVFPDKLTMLDALTDRELAHIDLGPEYRQRFRAPYMVAHRRDLHGALLAACAKLENVSLHTAKELVRFEERGDTVVAHCADGSEYAGRALIGADGLWSVVRQAVIGDGAPRATGHFSYRGVVPVEQVKDHSHIDSMAFWVGPNLHMVQYRLRGGTVMNNVATLVSGAFKRGEKQYAGPDELLDTFARTTDHTREMLSHVSKDRNWMLFDRDPMPGWTRGNVTLLGDAAHPTLQYLAQGACMAIEDAVVLAAKLADANGDINGALTAYEKERYFRTARVQITARVFGEIIHCGGGARDLRNHLLEQRVPGTAAEAGWLHGGIDVPQ